MDDLHCEPCVPQTHLNSEPSDSGTNDKSLKPTTLLHGSVNEGLGKKSGFHKTTRLCLHAIRDAILHHRWQEALQYLQSYCQTVEDTTAEKQLVACDVIWRLGIEVLQHHPNTNLEHFNVLYERMKNTGVKNYAKICLEHSFHLLLNGPVHKAKQQLSVALSWRYGKQSVFQEHELKLIHAYCGFLDYLIWTTKRASEPDAEEYRNPHEMHSYFRQASVTLQEIVKQPGVWDPFVWACIDMLDFYNDEEEALRLLQNYAYNKDYPSNPNAHIYLYKYQKKHKASPEQLISTLKTLHALVPSHELMLEYCDLLRNSEDQKKLRYALRVVMDLLEYTSWKYDIGAWTCLLEVLKHLKTSKLKNLIKEEWEGRRDLWLKMHYKPFNMRKDCEENSELLNVKCSALQIFGVYKTRYSIKYYEERKKKMNQKKSKS